MKYDHRLMCSQCEQLCQKYNFVEMFSVGESVTGKPIYCLKIGIGKKKLFISGAHHGLEYLTTAFILNFLERYSAAIDKGEHLSDYTAKELYEHTSLYAVPMVNPDGVDIAVNGIDIENRYHRELLRHVGFHNFESVWQSNVRGVALSHNYDANWNPIDARPSPAKYAGPYSESEPETQTLVKLAQSLNFDMVFDFQSPGGEIYYSSNGLTAPRSFELAQQFSQVSGYILSVPRPDYATGRFTDWFINTFGKEGFTIKIGYGQNPLPMSMLQSVYKENAPILLYTLKNI